MLEELSWKVGGQQGEGIDSTGETFATALNRQGYYIYGYRHFSSRIKGGHTNYKVRVSTKRRLASADFLDILIAFDQESIDFNAKELRSGAVVIADEKFHPTLPEGVKAELYVVPFTKLAETAGSSIMKNMVALGTSVYLLDLPVDIFSGVIHDTFARKGQKIVDQNMEAIRQGYQFMKEQLKDGTHMKLQPPAGKGSHLFMMGNDAVALGALTGGCRVMAAYPITPASDIMEYLIKKMPKVGGVVVQTEDEIAAINMIIGAAYGGARAMTATSGPGLSLMMEAIGLAGMTETPVVIVDTQRGGPSTGLPTKHEQSDLYAVLFGNHGEIPKIVLAPSTAEECFYEAARAFNLAERYQCPVILITDLALSLAKQTVEPLHPETIEIDRGKLITEVDPSMQSGSLFKRYAFTPDGISPRVIPGVKGGIHHVTGVEHNEIGRPDEGSANRAKMMEKRLRKLENVELDGSLTFSGDEHYDTLVIGIGSTRGPIEEAAERLTADGYRIGHVHVKVLAPFPTQALSSYTERAKKVIVVENNATGELAHLMRFFGVTTPTVSVKKFDGNPFLPGELYRQLKEWM
ncbi:MAG TPA: 2-oxoacid:acceptor oxidoreductase subunit alpha [Alicyclobacillus sp.]|nr:2-oxoacid:acceptor oxidoreductase subunit alpha [Alicyclobacillus sp.]